MQSFVMNVAGPCKGTMSLKAGLIENSASYMNSYEKYKRISLVEFVFLLINISYKFPQLKLTIFVVAGWCSSLLFPFMISIGGAENMNNTKSNIASNLRYLRNKNRLSQEEVAERIGVSRQSVAKWENGDSLPDILNCEALADLYDVSLNDLVRHNSEETGFPIPPKNKHLFGTVTIGERGQITLPKKARETFNLKPGDTLIVLGDTNPLTSGIALIDSESFFRMTGQAVEHIFKGKGDM